MVQIGQPSAVAARSPSSTPMLTVAGVNVYYGESHILRNVDLSVMAGEMVCLIGRNGVGKTTLMKTVIGLLRARSGSLWLEQVPIGAKLPNQRARLGIGYVPQGREIIPKLSVKENLLLGLESGRAREPVADLLDRAFELFPVLKTMVHRRGGDLSGGQQQQLAIARALMGQPKLLLLDEPTEGIQPSIVLEIEAAVRRIIATTGISVLLVEQHLHFVRQADRYYAMQRGSIVAAGPTANLTQEIVQEFLAV